jgi:hypothetical protein
MGQLAVPIMIGAAVGGGTKLLQGKGLGGILKGAALGGAMGGATGGLMGAAGGVGGAAGGTASQSAVGAAQGAGQGMGVGLLDAGQGMVFNPSSVLSSGAPGIPTSALESAIGQGVQLPAGVADALASNNIGQIPSSYLSQFGQYAQDYATPQNLLGVSQVLAQPSPAPNFSGGGGVRGGGAVQYEPISNVVVSSRKRRMSQNG